MGADAPDWKLLRGLFPVGEGFRHKMGLQRREFSEFYAATSGGGALRREKTAVLGEAVSDYVAVSEDGLDAFREFTGMLGQARENTEDPFAATRTLSLLVEPDFLLMMPPDWTLAWASVCFPSRWSLEGKLRRPLHEIHGVVPGLSAELGRKIAAFFARMVPGEGWGRANWGLSASMERNQHPRLATPDLTAEAKADETFIRVEDQHLLKMPRTGAIAFGIRVFSYRLSEVGQDAQVMAGLREKLRTMPFDISVYKGLKDFLTENK